jgi:cytochrome c
MTARFIPLAALALASASSQSAVAADAAAGEAIFKSRCMACHVVGAGQPGVLAPNLRGVVGRPAAATAFNYSPALKASGLTWTTASLDGFLAAPMQKVPGTRMVIAIGDARQRADVIAWLATLK